MSRIQSTSSAALLALADQRLPTGGHVHSGGAEQAVLDAGVLDVTALATFLDRRLRTAGLVAAGVAAAARRIAAGMDEHVVAGMEGPDTGPGAGPGAGPGDPASGLAGLDAETDARIPSPAQRDASRAQGRGLLRTARAAWAAPSPRVSWADLGARPHHPIVLGCVASAAGVDAAGVATVAAYLAVTGPATAAQRLLGLDPLQVAAVTLDLAAAIDEVARRAVDAVVRCAATGSWQDLPDDGDPLLDLLAARHATRDDRLFAS